MGYKDYSVDRNKRKIEVINYRVELPLFFFFFFEGMKFIEQRFNFKLNYYYYGNSIIKG